jgi:putative SOS response-associated peptidase YedK
LFTVAAVQDRWTDRETGEVLETCALITTTANRLWGEIHNRDRRMPAIIDAEHRSQWLDPQLDAGTALEMLEPYREDGLKAHTISKLISSRVDSALKNVPELVAEYRYDTLF